MSPSKFQYFITPVLTCVLPGLGLFSLGKRRLDPSLRHLSGRSQKNRGTQGYALGAQEARGINWNRRDSGWRWESCPLCEDVKHWNRFPLSELLVIKVDTGVGNLV